MTKSLCLVGFDSAWTDNAKHPGAISAALYDGARVRLEVTPRLATFDQAATMIEDLAGQADVTLIALDQPTIVPNLTGMRPVEKVAGSVVNAIGGGVQPANRSRTTMFGDDAPIWRFLARIGARQNPPAARVSIHGRFLIEVFPALVLPSWLPNFDSRIGAAKYNPAQKRKFLLSDWKAVCGVVAERAAGVGLSAIAAWAVEVGDKAHPVKADQDRLDAALCLLMAVHWRFAPSEEVMCIGDAARGYIATAVSLEIAAILRESASVRGVSVDAAWPADATSGSLSAMPPGPNRPRSPDAKPFVRHPPTVRQKPSSEKISFDETALRTFLVKSAKAGELVTYGEVAAHFGHPGHQGTFAALTAKLNVIAAGNKARGEPLLMALVVNQRERMPGPGFFREVRLAQSADRRTAFVRYCDEVFAYDWVERG